MNAKDFIQEATVEPLGLRPITSGRSVELLCYRERLLAAIPAVLRRLAPRGGSELSRTLLDGIALFESLDEAERERIVLQPIFAYWWTSLREACKGSMKLSVEELLWHFHRFLVGPTLRCGSNFPVKFQLSTVLNEVHLPGLGTIQTGEASPPRVSAEISDGILNVCGHKYTVSGSRDKTTLSVSGIRPPTMAGAIEVNARDPWIQNFFNSLADRASQRGDMTWDCEPAPSATATPFVKALDYIELSHAPYRREIDYHTRMIVPFKSAHYSSLTEGAFAGAVFLSEAIQPFSSTLYTAEHLLHEHSHFVLSLILEFDPLATDDGCRYRSPWRADLRPLVGMLHGVFVFARIAHLLRCSCESGRSPEGGDRLREVLLALRTAVSELEDNRHNISFTTRGSYLFEEIRQELYE